MIYIIEGSKFLPHQKKFFDCKISPKALVTGFGAGKTFVFIYETFRQYIENRNNKGKSNGWIIYPTLDRADELFVQPFMKLLDQANIRYNYNINKMHFESAYGDIRIYTLQRPQRMIGADLTFAGIDEFDVEREKLTAQAYTRILGRLRGNENPMFYITTTPEGFNSTYKIFVKKGFGKLFRGKTTDNPHLPSIYIENMKEQYDDQMIEQYMNGEFVNLKGHRAYYSFSRKNNVIKKDFILSDYILVGIDFNVTPMSAVIGIKKDNKIIIFDEIQTRQSNTWEMCKLIKEKYPQIEYYKAYPDMTGIKHTTSAQIGETDINIMKKNGFEIIGHTNKNQRDSLNVVNNAFMKRKILITENCEELIQDCEQVILDDNGKIDKSNLDRTHMGDAMRYLVDRELYSKQPRWRT